MLLTGTVTHAWLTSKLEELQCSPVLRAERKHMLPCRSVYMSQAVLACTAEYTQQLICLYLQDGTIQVYNTHQMSKLASLKGHRW